MRPMRPVGMPKISAPAAMPKMAKMDTMSMPKPPKMKAMAVPEMQSRMGQPPRPKRLKNA